MLDNIWGRNPCKNAHLGEILGDLGVVVGRSREGGPKDSDAQKSIRKPSQIDPKSIPNRPQNWLKIGLGGVLGRSWGVLGAPGAVLGEFPGVLGQTGRVLSRLGAVLGRSWGRPGRSWGRLGLSWRRPGAVLGRSWGVLGGLGGVLGKSWWNLGNILENLGRFSVVFKNVQKPKENQ